MGAREIVSPPIRSVVSLRETTMGLWRTVVGWHRRRGRRVVMEWTEGDIGDDDRDGDGVGMEGVNGEVTGRDGAGRGK